MKADTFVSFSRGHVLWLSLGLFVIFSLVVTSMTQASHPRGTKQAGASADQILLGEGAVRGGQVGLGWSIRDIRRSSTSQGQLERLVIEFGTLAGEAYTEAPGYYHAEMRAGGRRLLIDFAQLTRTSIDEIQLSRIFVDSPFVRQTDMTIDPEDNSLNITLDFKGPMMARVYPVRPSQGATSLVIDLRRAPQNRNLLGRGREELGPTPLRPSSSRRSQAPALTPDRIQ